MPPVTFSSDSLPVVLDDAARFRVWRDRYMEHHGQLDVSRSDHGPFSLRFTAARYGSVMVGQFAGTVSSVARTPHHIAASPSDTCCIVLNRGRSHMCFSHDGGEGALEAQTAALFLGAEPAELHGSGDNKVMFISIARSELAELVCSPQDLAGVPFDARSPTTRYLMRYLTMLSELDETDQGSALGNHIGTTLLDLAALALGATRDGTQRAGMRGLRAARAQDVITRIAASFTNPELSPVLIAAELGLSARYVQDLLQETGTPFTERVLELRLQRARALLADARNDRLKVSEIAHGCGFNEVSYFNRCFRRRFGLAPGDCRARG